MKNYNWIPCSERLPKYCEWYYVTVKPFYEGKENYVAKERYDCKMGEWSCCERAYADKVIAWLPDPEPWDETEGAVADTEAEQDALIVKLPVAVGDTVYKICPVSKYIEMGDMRDGKIVKTECARCGYRGSFSGCHNIGFQKGARNVIVPRKLTSLVDVVKIMPFWNEIYYLTEEEAAAAVARMMETE